MSLLFSFQISTNSTISQVYFFLSFQVSHKSYQILSVFLQMFTKYSRILSLRFYCFRSKCLPNPLEFLVSISIYVFLYCQVSTKVAHMLFMNDKSYKRTGILFVSSPPTPHPPKQKNGCPPKMVNPKKVLLLFTRIPQGCS